MLAKQNIAQIGWASALMPHEDTYKGYGVGDDEGSWGVDGVREVIMFPLIAWVFKLPFKNSCVLYKIFSGR